MKKFTYWLLAVANDGYFVFIGTECDLFGYTRNFEVVVGMSDFRLTGSNAYDP
jgi:hypothetical protein